MLNAKNLGLSAGIVWGLGLFIVTILSILTGYGSTFIAVMESVYPGYTPDFAGSLIGLLYGFVDGFVGFYIFGLIYNWLNGRESTTSHVERH